jgi:protein EFR3
VVCSNVQVTLQIITAVIEKTPRDLSLYSKSVLTILDTVLRSGDINMVEESLPTFEAYCKYVDSAALAADQQRARQYITLVELYASFAKKDGEYKPQPGQSLPISLRWRTAGLRGIRAAVSSDALSADSAKQLDLVILTILENMALEDSPILASLQSRVKTSEKQDVEMARRRRMSSATVTTVDTVDNHQLQAAETTADADKAAEEDVRILAVRCLKQIFSSGIATNRGQTRLATAIVLRFIASKNPSRTFLYGVQQGSWATSLFETIARWTPVQDRFIIIITAMEALIRSPIIESVLERQLVLASMIDWLLSSDINLIGLSVMDVLLGLVQHTLLLLQLGGRDSKTIPLSQQADTLGLFRETKETFDPGASLIQPDRGRSRNNTESTPSPTRQELLLRLQRCIASLSNHIYYTDQISDMMSAILSRLKPSPSSDVPTTTAAINDPVATTKMIADSANLQEDPTTDSFFSFATARVAALKAVKDVLIRANNRRSASGASLEARARVGVQVWDGTQWLLKDEEADVRTAYVDALLTWLRLETNRTDMLLPQDGPRKKVSRKSAPADGGAKAAKRAVSNASRRELKSARSAFLQLLHLAIYDSILDRATSEPDILVLYLLLTKLVERLGVNALRTGLPMILRLQETALNEAGTFSSNAKVNVASLIHGYLWTTAEKFEFEMNSVGHEINAEIARRKRFGIWFDKIKFPAIPVDSLQGNWGQSEKEAVYVEDAIGTLRPFLNVTNLINEVATAYDLALLTPTASPPSSPGRVFSVPTLGFGYGYGVAAGPKPSPKDQLPQKIRDEMGSSWTRETCIAAVEKESTGSVTGASSRMMHHLSVNSANKHESTDGKDKSNGNNADAGHGYGLLSGLQKSRKASANGSPLVLTATSSRDSTLKVTDLKRALITFNGGGRQLSPLQRPKSSSMRSTTSLGTDSMVSWNEADDHNTPTTKAVGVNDKTPSRPPTSASKSPKDAADMSNGAEASERPATSQADRRLGEDVPPVPKIPSNLNLPGTYPRDASPARGSVTKLERQISQTEDSSVESPVHQTQRAGSSSFAGSSVRGGKLREPKRASRPPSRASVAAYWNPNETRSPAEKVDVGSLLAGIRSTSESSPILESNTAAGKEKEERANEQTPLLSQELVDWWGHVLCFCV